MNLGQFVLLGCTVSYNFSLEADLNKCIGKAAMVLSMLTMHALTNSKLTEHTMAWIYLTCVIIMLLYGSKTWTKWVQAAKRG